MIVNNLKNTKPVILYDGVCNLCGELVRFLLKIDKSNKFKFLPLQELSEKEKIKLKIYEENYTTLFLVSKGKIFTKCSALISIFEELEPPWKWLKFIKIFPLALCNKVYDAIAKVRYKVFGKKSCVANLNDVSPADQYNNI